MEIKKAVDLWECRACGEDQRCKLEIHAGGDYADERFKKMPCICAERLIPAWKKLATNAAPKYPWVVEL